VRETDMDREQALRLDEQDELAGSRNHFVMPADTIYLDGNSLGAMPVGVTERMQRHLLEEWATDLIQSWNRHQWISMPTAVGEKIAPLLGATTGQVIVADSTSINLFKLLVTGLRINGKRNEVLTETDNFPTDLYMAQGVTGLMPGAKLRMVSAADLLSQIGSDTAVVMLTHTDFRTGEIRNMEAVTAEAHRHGALVLWDLSHSTGVMPIHLDEYEVDMAVGCTYKYLNGGPGSPAYLYLAKSLQNRVAQPLTGWMGHRQPFAFQQQYEAANGMQRYLSGTPAILSLVALDCALDVFKDVDLGAVRKKSLALGDYFIQSMAQLPDCKLISPVGANRGSQVSFCHPSAYAIVQALIETGVIGDFREPDIMRFGLSPLYTRFVDIFDAVTAIEEVVASGRFMEPRFAERKVVT
jgi:kynureninase